MQHGISKHIQDEEAEREIDPLCMVEESGLNFGTLGPLQLLHKPHGALSSLGPFTESIHIQAKQQTDSFKPARLIPHQKCMCLVLQCLL